MSYYCEIHFKQLPADEVYEFLQKFKTKAIEEIPSIANDVSLRSPLAFALTFEKGDKSIEELKRETIAWGRDNVFTYRYFYIKELQLLGVYGVDAQLASLFDCMIPFQDSTDQDYPLDTWSQISAFNQIATKWKRSSEEEVKVVYMNRNIDDSEFDVEYWRRSIVYSQIWDMVNDTFNNDDHAIYLKLFSSADIYHMSSFYAFVKQSVEEIMGLSIEVVHTGGKDE